jgi:enoyl-CoA hydratase
MSRSVLLWCKSDGDAFMCATSRPFLACSSNIATAKIFSSASDDGRSRARRPALAAEGTALILAATNACEADFFGLCFATADQKEGMSAFLENARGVYAAN